VVFALGGELFAKGASNVLPLGRNWTRLSSLWSNRWAKWDNAENTPVFVDLNDRKGGTIVLLVIVDFEKPQLDREIFEEGFSWYP